MSDLHSEEILLRVPGDPSCALILRTTLGGVAILHDLTVDQLDDLRTAADEACDCLLHQGRDVAALVMRVTQTEGGLTVSIEAEFAGEGAPEHLHGNADVALAVLETLIPQVTLGKTECGCICKIGLTMPAVA